MVVTQDQVTHFDHAKNINDDITPHAMPTTDQKTPTTFLSLPHELRQPILLEAILFPSSQFGNDPDYFLLFTWARNVRDRAAKLKKTHTDLSGDVEYAEQKAMEYVDLKCMKQEGQSLKAFLRFHAAPAVYSSIFPCLLEGTEPSEVVKVKTRARRRRCNLGLW